MACRRVRWVRVGTVELVLVPLAFLRVSPVIMLALSPASFTLSRLSELRSDLSSWISPFLVV